MSRVQFLQDFKYGIKKGDFEDLTETATADLIARGIVQLAPKVDTFETKETPKAIVNKEISNDIS